MDLVPLDHHEIRITPDGRLYCVEGTCACRPGYGLLLAAWRTVTAGFMVRLIEEHRAAFNPVEVANAQAH